MIEDDSETLRDSPEGIDVGDRFLSYIHELRETWQPDEELKEKYVGSHVSGAENSRLDTNDSDIEQQQRSSGMNFKRIGFATLMAAILISSTVTMPVMAAGGIGWTDAKTPNPEIGTDVTIDEWSNADFSSALMYYDDAGESATLPASLNDSNDNPITLTATDIDFEDRNEFPRLDSEDGDNSASALDSSEWTVSGASVSGSTTAPGVDALNYVGSATSDSATYTNVSVSDGEKSYVTIAADITSASGTPTLQLNDSDGDYVEITLFDSTANADADAVLANSTGEGKVLQQQLGSLTVQGTGDGTFSTISEITINGQIDADVSVLDAERTRAIQFGEKLEDTDSDDELETVTIEEPRGAYAVTGIDTFDSVMSSATVFGMTVDAEFQASDLTSDEDVNAEFGASSDYPQWDQLGEFDYRLTLPTAFDLSYAGPELVDEPSLPSERYKSVQIAEGTDDTAFADIESYSSVASSYDGSESISLDSTVSTDTSYVVSYEVVLTNDEVDAIQSAVDAGGAAIMGSNDGGIIGFLTSLPGLVVSAITGFIGIRVFGNGGN